MRVNIWALLLALLFALFAMAQLNDVDPWAWVSLYLLVAAILAFSAFGRYRPWAVWVGLAVIVGWMIFLLPEFVNWIQMGMPTITGQMKATAPHVEYTREFLGLLIAGLALGWVAWRMRRTA